jgi:general secretion pathway protein J
MIARSKRHAARGMTLLEILVSISILAVIALLIYGAFDSMSRGRKGEQMRTDRSHQGRDAMARMMRELQSAFLSLHNPQAPALITRTTAFIGQSGGTYDRIDFAAFAHRRIDRDAKESDQAEVGYFVVKDPDVTDKYDLCRREQTPIDMEPRRGGIVNVLAEDVQEFDVRYLDPMTGLWTETWDTTQVNGQPGRLPLEIKITLVLKGLPKGDPYSFTSRVMLPIRDPLSFGIPKQ